jgi:hypothetical protein
MEESPFLDILLPEIRIIIVRFIPTARDVKSYACACRRTFRDMIEADPIPAFQWSSSFTEIPSCVEFFTIGGPPEPVQHVWKPTIIIPRYDYKDHWLFANEKPSS